MTEHDARHCERSRLYEELFARVPIGLYRSTPDGMIVDANPALVRMLGYPNRDALLGNAATSIYARDGVRTRWLAEMEQSSTVTGFEAEWRCRDGSTIWVKENAYAVRSDEGHVLHYEGSAEDVTTRRGLEQRLSLESARFEQLFEASPEAVVLCDNDGVVQRINDEFTRLFGYAEPEAVGHRVDDLVSGGRVDLEAEARAVTQAIAEGRTTFVEAKRRHKNGTLIDVSILGKPVMVDGRQQALYAIYRDIREQVRMESRLREEKARFEQLFASAPEAVVLCANDGTIVRVNEEFRRLFGYASDEALGANIDQLIAPDANGLHREASRITQRIVDGEHSFVETVRWRKDGSLVHVSILGKPILIDGDQIAVYGIYRDITARKQAEAALAQSHTKVEKLHEVADALSEAVSEGDIYRITCNAAKRVLGFSHGMVCILDEKEFICQAPSSNAAASEMRRVPVDPHGIAARALTHGRVVIVDDPTAEQALAGIPANTRSLICAPIGDLGVFQAASPEQVAFDEDDGRLLGILLGHAAVGVTRLRLQQELIRQARHDALTGVFNRHYFNELIAEEVIRSSRYNHPIGLLMIDVDRFKEINDRYGHQTGDLVLREIATVLRATVRKSDMIVRYGGDEFLVVLTETGQDAEEAAVRVRRAVHESETLRRISGFDVTVSVGSIFWRPEDGTPIEEALATADERMYSDKRRH